VIGKPQLEIPRKESERNWNPHLPQRILAREESFGSTGSSTSSKSHTGTSYNSRSTSMSELCCSGYSSHRQRTSSSTTADSTTAPDRCVTFDYIHMATIYYIPSHKSMSREERNQQWWEPHEMERNIARNIVEFDYEQWDWQKVVEEEGFTTVRDDVSCDQEKAVLLVHPVHVLRYYQQQLASIPPTIPAAPSCLIQQHFCKIRKAQQIQQSYNQYRYCGDCNPNFQNNN
jgi:hypothetical protein